MHQLPGSHLKIQLRNFLTVATQFTPIGQPNLQARVKDIRFNVHGGTRIRRNFTRINSKRKPTRPLNRYVPADRPDYSIAVEIATCSNRGKTEIHILHGGTLIHPHRSAADRDNDITRSRWRVDRSAGETFQPTKVSDNYVSC